MQISESERILLIQKKEDIHKLSQEILDITGKKQTTTQDVIDVKKKMVQILSLLHIISSYSSPNRDLNALMKLVIRIFTFQAQSKDQIVLPQMIELFCTIANSVEFSYGWFPTIFKAQIKEMGLEIQK
jgi:hypothetical protein